MDLKRRLAPVEEQKTVKTRKKDVARGMCALPDDLMFEICAFLWAREHVRLSYTCRGLRRQCELPGAWTSFFFGGQGFPQWTHPFKRHVVDWESRHIKKLYIAEQTLMLEDPHQIALRGLEMIHVPGLIVSNQSIRDLILTLALRTQVTDLWIGGTFYREGSGLFIAKSKPVAPNIKKLHINNLSRHDHPSDVVETVPNVESLQLDVCSHIDVFFRTFSPLKNLKQLHFVASSLEEIDPDEVLLMPQLEVLSMTFAHYNEYEIAGKEVRLLANLAKLRNLRRLRYKHVTNKQVFLEDGKTQWGLSFPKEELQMAARHLNPSQELVFSTGDFRWTPKCRVRRNYCVKTCKPLWESNFKFLDTMLE